MYTVVPRFNELLYNEVGITSGFFLSSSAKVTAKCMQQNLDKTNLYTCITKSLL